MYFSLRPSPSLVHSVFSTSIILFVLSLRHLVKLSCLLHISRSNLRSKLLLHLSSKMFFLPHPPPLYCITLRFNTLKHRATQLRAPINLSTVRQAPWQRFEPESRARETTTLLNKSSGTHLRTSVCHCQFSSLTIY